MRRLFPEKSGLSGAVVERGVRMPRSDGHAVLDLVEEDGILVAASAGIHGAEPWLELDWGVVSAKFREEFLAAGNGEEA